MNEVLAGVFLLIGALFLFLAGLSLLRLPDLFTRLSASTKAVVFGAGLVFVAVLIFFNEVATDARAVAGILFFAITAPIAGTVIGRSARRTGVPIWPDTLVDDSDGVSKSVEPSDDTVAKDQDDADSRPGPTI